MKQTTIPILAATLTLGGVAFATFSPRFQEAPAALEQHAFVQEGVGHWTGTMEMYLPGVDEPVSVECTESVEALGEFWSIAEFEMDFMGTEFRGHNTFGYDPHKEAFVGTWIDSMTQSMIIMEGNVNERTGQLVMEYEQHDEMTGGMKSTKQIMERGENAYTLTFFDVTAEGDVKTMELSMQRKRTAEAGAMRGEKMERGEKAEASGEARRGGRKQ